MATTKARLGALQNELELTKRALAALKTEVSGKTVTISELRGHLQDHDQLLRKVEAQVDRLCLHRTDEPLDRRLETTVDGLVRGAKKDLELLREREEKIELLTKELEKQRALTKEGHRQYDAVHRKLEASDRLNEDYETTIRVLGALLAAKPREKRIMLGFDWGLGKDRTAFEIPVSLEPSKALRDLERDVMAGLKAEAKRPGATDAAP